ncbi:hypothetical protein FKM82_018339 [Ascaphus truei]
MVVGAPDVTVGGMGHGLLASLLRAGETYDPNINVGSGRVCPPSPPLFSILSPTCTVSSSPAAATPPYSPARSTRSKSREIALLKAGSAASARETSSGFHGNGCSSPILLQA